MSTTYADVNPGDTIYFEPLERELVVTAIEPTGSVKFGQIGPDATPILRVTTDGMPKPFKGHFETAADAHIEILRPKSDLARCDGCGTSFKGVRGLRAHRSQRYGAMGCK